MKIVSLDPRFQRAELPDESQTTELSSAEEFHTYEVFHQKKRGAHHSHVGILHAPNAEMAIVFAKEQFGRRGQTTNLWVVRSADVIAMDYEDSDVFDTTPGKLHREAAAYKTRDKIEKFKEENQ